MRERLQALIDSSLLPIVESDSTPAYGCGTRRPSASSAVAVLRVKGGSVRAWHSPFGQCLHVVVLTRAERRFIRLSEDFDMAEILGGTHWVVGGVLDKQLDGIELVTDDGGRHRPLLCRHGWPGRAT
jgi:hypothetical protein